ncbi:COR domain-containing protein [Micromonosporaceae bacterium DT194]|uniref:COR domain-containing protein n=1 Tax=Melissospora conviva TaxID=3388432 RepID=UPI003C272B48
MTKVDMSGLGAEMVKGTVFGEARITSLDLSGNDLTSVDIDISSLKMLRTLKLSNNRLREFPTELLGLPRLASLDLSGNQISSIPPEISELKGLRTLRINDNVLASVNSGFGKLTQLETLEVARNQLIGITDKLQGLAKLKTLDVSVNYLGEIQDEFKYLKSLRRLKAAGNRIATLTPELAGLRNLEFLDLRDNYLTDLPYELGDLPDRILLKLEGNSFAGPFSYVAARDTPSILNYLRSNKDSTEQFEAKLVLVGEGAVGKTSLLAKLRGEEFIENRPTTHGIEIDRLKVPHATRADVSIELNTWDFGGQEVYRITHQFFFSQRALYLLLWKPREGQEENAIEGWVRRIRLRIGSDARIVLVATHASERRPEIDFPMLRRRYGPLLVANHAVDSSTDEGLAELRKIIAMAASRLPQIGERLPASWVRAREEILGLDEPFITRLAFERICALHGLDEESTETFSELLHDLGHIVYYGEDEGLRDLVVLDPEWLTKAIGYVLEDSETRTKAGVLSHSRLGDIWAPRGGTEIYPPKYFPYFLRLMEKFDVSYRLPDDSSSLVAQLVPYERPVLPVNLKNPAEQRRSLRMVCRTQEVAPGLIAWLTVRSHQYSTGLHWRRGVFLLHRKYNTQALLELADNNLDLVIAAQGPAPDYFFYALRDGIEELIGRRWPGLKYEFLVPCLLSDDGGRACMGHFPATMLEKLRARGEPRAICHRCANWRDVNELLTGFELSHRPFETVMSDIKELQEKTLDALGGIQAKAANIAHHVRAALNILSAEVVDCPRLFSLYPTDRSAIVERFSFRQSMTLQLWCEEPGEHHPVGDAKYTFKPSKEWFVQVSPYLKAVLKILSIAGPIAIAAVGASLTEQDLVKTKPDLDLMKALVDKLPQLDVDEAPALHRESGWAEGAGLRALRGLLLDLDPNLQYGGMRRVISSSGDLLWVCERHHRTYDPGLPVV